MAWFSSRRTATTSSQTATPEIAAVDVPPRFEAVAEALQSHAHIVEACWVAGRQLAEEGASLGEALEGLRSVTRLLDARDPLFEESHALSLAWSEATLAYLHQLSCSDPLTGLSTLAHIRERLSELYREAAERSYALVVSQVPLSAGVDAVSAAQTISLLGQTARAVFSGTEAIGQVGFNRLVVVAARDERLPGRVSLLRRMAEPGAVRVWIEGLPPTDDRAAALLDELARGA